jgi:hypothetical protein
VATDAVRYGARQAVKETNAGANPSGLGSTVLPTISVCDVDLVHQSHISDEEELRFQMGVSVYGLERDSEPIPVWRVIGEGRA